MRDVRLLLWLRVRHARWTLNRLMHFVGAGIDDDGWAERAYQLYALALMLVWLVLMVAALLYGVREAFAAADASLHLIALQLVLLVGALVLARRGIAAVRTSPLKLSHPDIAYLAASALSAWALVGVAAVVQGLAGGAALFVLGALVGVGLESAGVLAMPPAALGLAAAPLGTGAVLAGWLAGVARLAAARWRTRTSVAVGAGFVVAAVGWAAAVSASGPSALYAPATLIAMGVLAALVCLALGVALAMRAPRIDMTLVIEESTLHADLCRFDVLSPLDRNDIAAYQRRRKLAARPVRFGLARGEGRAALVAHAALSHLRQYDGIPLLLMQGSFVVPLGVLAVLGVGGPALFLFWLSALVMAPMGVREATRAFRDDMGNRLVRDRLPFGALELLVFDSLPAFALTTLVACAVSVALAPAAVPLPAVLALVVLLNVGPLLCCGLDAVRLGPRGPRLCYEYGALAFVGAAFLLALRSSVPEIAAGMALVCILLAVAVRSSVECAG